MKATPGFGHPTPHSQNQAYYFRSSTPLNVSSYMKCAPLRVGHTVVEVEVMCADASQVPSAEAGACTS
jgi:hypothetical protein